MTGGMLAGAENNQQQAKGKQTKMEEVKVVEKQIGGVTVIKPVSE